MEIITRQMSELHGGFGDVTNDLVRGNVVVLTKYRKPTAIILPFEGSEEEAEELVKRIVNGSRT